MAAKQDPLARYNEKRDFSKTAEPAGTYDKLSWGQGNGFMVQKHDARRLHFDFRLELDGTLKSWAVPNGPSLNPADKRLAVRTEDHPLSYATFEGTIPKGEYGGGTVMLWDRGTWTPAPGKDPRKTLEEGHLHFTLHGERMQGDWVMFRLKGRPGERTENWMLKKVTDEHAGGSMALTERYLTCIKTGRTMQEIAAGKKAKELADWKRGLKAKASASSPSFPRKRESRLGTEREEKKRDSRFRGNDVRSGRSATLPSFREPQKATLVDHVPSGPGWIHEMKYDGYRCLLAVGGGEAKVYTRSGLDWSDKFPEIVEAARSLEVGSALLDGDIVKVAPASRRSSRR
jgi:bifunctional non-homologous end joining protein LigD